MPKPMPPDPASVLWNLTLTGWFRIDGGTRVEMETELELRLPVVRKYGGQSCCLAITDRDSTTKRCPKPWGES